MYIKIGWDQMSQYENEGYEVSTKKEQYVSCRKFMVFRWLKQNESMSEAWSFWKFTANYIGIRLLPEHTTFLKRILHMDVFLGVPFFEWVDAGWSPSSPSHSDISPVLAKSLPSTPALDHRAESLATNVGQWNSLPIGRPRTRIQKKPIQKVIENI